MIVDGAVSQGLEGNSGLLAGCSSARDVLKAFLLDITILDSIQVRDYVDDLVVVYEEVDAALCADGLYKKTREIKNWLQANNMVVNEQKEQVWGHSAEMARRLTQAGFREDTVHKQVKDLGVCLRRHKKDLVLPGRLTQAEGIGKHIAAAGMTKGIRATQVKAMIFSGGLYGTEVAGANTQHIIGLRKVVA